MRLKRMAEKNNVLLNLDYNKQVIPDENIIENINTLLDFLLGRSGCEISLLVTTDQVIQMYNKQTRGKDRATDVLSYPMEFDLNLPVVALGEIIISMDTCLRQAGELGVIPEEEFYRLLVHGLLHLLGYDHETGEEDAQRMRAKEDECLDLLYSR